VTSIADEAGAPDRGVVGIRAKSSDHGVDGDGNAIHQSRTMASPSAPDFQPPLPNEPEPAPAARPAAAVVSDEEEDDALRDSKGKAKADGGSDEEVWDPAAGGTELEGRKAEEKQTTVTGTTSTTTATSTGTDTGGWQAVWAPAQNGELSSR
jgi:hypothetical protein